MQSLEDVRGADGSDDNAGKEVVFVFIGKLRVHVGQEGSPSLKGGDDDVVHEGDLALGKVRLGFVPPHERGDGQPEPRLGIPLIVELGCDALGPVLWGRACDGWEWALGMRRGQQVGPPC